MTARQVARQFCRLGEVHSRAYGRRASGENDRKLTVGTRVGSKNRLMDYPGLSLISQFAAAASFDCHKAQTPTELSICSEAELVI